MTWRLQFYWRGRREDEGRHGRRAMDFVRAFGDARPGSGSWLWEHPATGAREALELPGDFEAALAASVTRWRSGARMNTSHVVNLRCEERGALRVECRLTLGVFLGDLKGLFAPEQARVVVHRAVGDEAAVRATLEAALASAVATFDPAWGHAGSVRTPSPAVPIFDDGGVRPGWWTYLRDVPATPTLRAPARARAVGGRGLVVYAHPELFDERSRDHLRAIEAVRLALRDAGALAPRWPE